MAAEWHRLEFDSERLRCEVASTAEDISKLPAVISQCMNAGVRLLFWSPAFPASFDQWYCQRRLPQERCTAHPKT